MILDQESLLLPNLEGFCLFSKTGVGELVLVLDGCIVVKNEYLLAIPSIVVTGI